MSTTLEIQNRNRIENGKHTYPKCKNCEAVGREYRKLRNESERLFKENQELKRRLEELEK